MADNIKEKFSAFGEKLKVGGSDLTRRMSERMNTVSGKMKELFLVPTPADKFVEEATVETLDGPDWGKNLEICDQINHERIGGQDAVRAIKKRIIIKNSTIQTLALTLLETLVKNCDKMFSEVASEKVLDEMVKLIDDRQTSIESREKALKLIEAWGESSEELRYLPVFEETYKSLRSRGVAFPGRDAESLAPIFTPPQTRSTPSPARFRDEVPSQWRNDYEVPSEGQGNHGNSASTKEVLDVARNSAELLSTVLSSSPHQEALQDEITTTLVDQCRQSQTSLQGIIQRAAENDPHLFEALNLNDELQRVLSKYEEISKPGVQTRPLMPIFDDDETHSAGAEDALVRNYGHKMVHTPLSVHGDDTAMADLDEMIFGKKSGPRGERS